MNEEKIINSIENFFSSSFINSYKEKINSELVFFINNEINKNFPNLDFLLQKYVNNTFNNCSDNEKCQVYNKIKQSEDGTLTCIYTSECYKKTLDEIYNNISVYTDSFLSDYKSDFKELRNIWENIENEKLNSILNTYKSEYLRKPAFDSSPDYRRNDYLDYTKQSILINLWEKAEEFLFNELTNKDYEIFADSNIKDYNEYIKDFIKNCSLNKKITEDDIKEIHRNKIILRLWMTLGANEILCWLPNASIDGDKGAIIVKDYYIVFDKRKFNNFIHAIKYMNPYFSRYFKFGDIIPIDFRLSGENMPKFPIELYQKLTGKKEDEIFSSLAHEFSIDIEDSLKPMKVDGRTKWKQTHIEEIKDKYKKFTIPFRIRQNENCTVGYVIYNPETNLRLPLSNWRKNNITETIELNIPFTDNYSKKIPLYNLDQITLHKKSDVILTKNLSFASAVNNLTDFKFILSSWYGEHHNIDYIDWKILADRNVFYLIILADSEEQNQLEVKTAYEVYLHNKHFNFIQTKIALSKERNINKIKCEESKFMLPEDFRVYSEKYLCINDNSEETEKLNRSKIKPRTISSLSNRKDRSFLFAPLILENTVTLLYAPTSVGKTWLAMTIAYAISIGGRIFNTWYSKIPRKILYIDNEMDSISYETRLNIIKKMDFHVSRKRINNNADNFMIILKEDNLYNLSFEDFLEEVISYVKNEKIKLIVLDNLSTFTNHNDSAKAWETINSWLSKLQKAGCSSLIVHHANKKTDQRGTSAKVNTADNIIKLINKTEDEETDSDLFFEICIEKGRDLFEVSKEPITVKLYANRKTPKWETINIENIEDLEGNIIRKLNEQGVSNKYIENYLGWGKSKLIKRKEALGIKSVYRKLNNEYWKES